MPLPPLKFHLIGDWLPGHIHCSWSDSTLVLSQKAQDLISDEWESVARRGVRLFDGPMCRLESYAARGNDLSLTFSRTSYRIFVGTNLSHPELGDEFGVQSLANPVGVSSGLLSCDGYMVMGRRNRSVAYYPNRIHPFAGALEPREPLDVFDEVRRELAEELSFGPADIADIRCLGLVEDVSLRQPELVFITRSTRTLIEIEALVDKKEHDASWSIESKAEDIKAAMRRSSELTPVAVAALLLWGRKEFGATWFSAQVE